MAPDLPILVRPREHAELLSRFLIDRFEAISADEPIQILEAGCGRKWPIELNETRFVLTGVDNDEDALKLRRETDSQLAEAICASLLDVDFQPRRFDVIYCSFVLEHIDGAELVLDRFLRWLKPGGVMILKIPDRNTVYGFVARSTPFWLHVQYKRWIEHQPNAGKPGYDPFPVFYDAVVSRIGMHEYCAKTDINLLIERGMDYYLNRLGALLPLAKFCIKLIGLLSFGRLKTSHNNLLFVIERPEE